MVSDEPLPSSIAHYVMDEVAAIIGALVGGLKYGIKIRTPHALLMTILFRSDLNAKQKIHNIVKLVKEHASNLAAFATIYKSLLAIMKWSSRSLLHDHPSSNGTSSSSSSSSSSASPSRSWGRIVLQLIIDGPLSFTSTKNLPRSLAGHPERPYHALVAGGVGGYFVWGKYSSVNRQVVLYLTSRIIVGLSKRLWEKCHGTPHHHPTSIIQHKQTYPVLAAAVWGIVMMLFEESPAVLDSSLKKSMDEIYRHTSFKLSSSGSTVSDIGGGNKNSHRGHDGIRDVLE